MKKLLVVVLSAVLLSGCSFPSFAKKNAGIQVHVSNDQSAEVFLNDISLGDTPLESKELKPGSFTLKLVPKDSKLQPYETTITLASGLVTVVSWTFGTELEQSGGEILELSKISGKKAELSLVTSPDNIVVKVDGQSKGFSPLVLNDLAEGPHTVTVTAPGYVERTVNPQLAVGYRLTVTTKLAREATNALTEIPTATPAPTVAATPKASSTPKPSLSPSPRASSSATPTPISSSTTPPVPYAEIKETGTGWLRVRAEASADSAELAKLNVGVKVPYLNETTNGWHKVEYATGKEGWVSGQYAVLHTQ